MPLAGLGFFLCIHLSKSGIVGDFLKLRSNNILVPHFSLSPFPWRWCMTHSEPPLMCPFLLRTALFHLSVPDAKLQPDTKYYHEHSYPPNPEWSLAWCGGGNTCQAGSQGTTVPEPTCFLRGEPLLAKCWGRGLPLTSKKASHRSAMRGQWKQRCGYITMMVEPNWQSHWDQNHSPQDGLEMISQSRRGKKEITRRHSRRPRS